MPIYAYSCDQGHEWDERRDRNDPDIDRSESPCDPCTIPGGPSYEFGRRLPTWFRGAPAVYFHGRGWSRVDKNYRAGE
jgi:hypothetical protein